MMTSLDQRLLRKIAEKKKKDLPYIRQQISKRANRLNITSETAQLVWAKELGFSINSALQKLDPHVQSQVRDTLVDSEQNNFPSQPTEAASPPRNPDKVSQSIELLITDPELKSRCADLLRRKKHSDRVYREATVVLENRIKSMSGIKNRLNPEALVNIVLSPDRTKALLLYGTEAADQQGFHSVCRGLVLAFRHPSHHSLDDDITQAEALKFCAFIDHLLHLLGTTKPGPASP